MHDKEATNTQWGKDGVFSKWSGKTGYLHAKYETGLLSHIIHKISLQMNKGLKLKNFWNHRTSRRKCRKKSLWHQSWQWFCGYTKSTNIRSKNQRVALRIMKQDLRIAAASDLGRHWLGPRILHQKPECFATRSYWLLEGYGFVPACVYFSPCSGL